MDRLHAMLPLTFTANLHVGRYCLSSAWICFMPCCLSHSHANLHVGRYLPFFSMDRLHAMLPLTFTANLHVGRYCLSSAWIGFMPCCPLTFTRQPACGPLLAFLQHGSASCHVAAHYRQTLITEIPESGQVL
ncbi:hypothetical protein BaRGS_00017779 [Batillaria attramentaria]|uniref:Secreted protein n=1 Tax=Batillaria attramentaria TaxID=370345 RepID=A0ABD0KUN2_9CAEN